MSQDYLNIKNYSFQKDIGEGNFGKVKLAIFKPTGEEFAIKILNKNKIKIKMKNSIFKENEIIIKFNHINVICLPNSRRFPKLLHNYGILQTWRII